MFDLPPTQFSIFVFFIVFIYGGYKILKEKDYLNTLDRKMLILTLLIIFGIYLYEVLVLNIISIVDFLFILGLLMSSAYIGIKDGKNLLEIQGYLKGKAQNPDYLFTEEKFESIKAPVIALLQSSIDKYASLEKSEVKNKLILFKNRLDRNFIEVISQPDGILEYRKDLKDLLDYFHTLKNI